MPGGVELGLWLIDHVGPPEQAPVGYFLTAPTIWHRICSFLEVRTLYVYHTHLVSLY